MPFARLSAHYNPEMDGEAKRRMKGIEVQIFRGSLSRKLKHVWSINSRNVLKYKPIQVDKYVKISECPVSST